MYYQRSQSIRLIYYRLIFLERGNLGELASRYSVAIFERTVANPLGDVDQFGELDVVTQLTSV